MPNVRAAKTAANRATSLVPSRYKNMQDWINSETAAGYDLRGYISKYGVPDTSAGQHLTDEYKLPNHITFSTDSKYSTPETPGGTWAQDADKKWHYTPSNYVLSQHPAEELQRYFDTREPDSVLDLPEGPTATE